MRCRSCGLRFGLAHTTAWGATFGNPVTPRQALFLFAGLVQVSLLLVSPVAAAVFTLLSVAALLVWFMVYLDWLLFQGNPFDRTRAGTCPACKEPNLVWPWSA